MEEYEVWKHIDNEFLKRVDNKISGEIFDKKIGDIKQRNIITNKDTIFLPDLDIKEGFCELYYLKLRNFFPDKSISCFYVDPPWSYSNKSTRNSVEHDDTWKYNTLTLDVLKELPIERISTDKAHLWLWTTKDFIFDALPLINSWGFEYKTVFTWVKPQYGMGNYNRVHQEFLFLGSKGDLRTLRNDDRSVFIYDRIKHSQKPNEFRQLIESLSPGPNHYDRGKREYEDAKGKTRRKQWIVYSEDGERYFDKENKDFCYLPEDAKKFGDRLELFSRHYCPGWIPLGNEVPKSYFRKEINIVEDSRKRDKDY